MDRMTSENAGEDLYDHHWAFGNMKAVTGVCMSRSRVRENGF